MIRIVAALITLSAAACAQHHDAAGRPHLVITDAAHEQAVREYDAKTRAYYAQHPGEAAYDFHRQHDAAGADAVDNYIAKLRAEADYAQVHRYDSYKPSDVADCRSRGNAAFGDLDTKYAVMNDCLLARKLRAAGK